MRVVKNPAYFLKIQEKRITSPNDSVGADALQKLIEFSCSYECYNLYPANLVNKGRRLVAQHYK